jgi:hypothetical protein
MVPAIASDPLQDHRVLHTPLTGKGDPIREFVNTAEYAGSLAIPRFHLRHERQRIALASVIKSCKNLFSRAYFH